VGRRREAIDIEELVLEHNLYLGYFLLCMPVCMYYVQSVFCRQCNGKHLPNDGRHSAGEIDGIQVTMAIKLNTFHIP
jgi:hypothetical protein